MNEMGYDFTLIKIDEIDDSVLRLTKEQGGWFERVLTSTRKKRKQVRFRWSGIDY